MDTTESKLPSLNITKEEAEKIKADFQKARIECTEKTLVNMKKDIEYIDQILQDIQVPDVTFDELIIPLHNLMCIVPEEQYRFHAPIRKLFTNLPRNVKEDADAQYCRKRLKEMKKAELDTKMQTTDLSMYWSRYRALLYKYGIWDNDIQEETQNAIRKEMLQVCINTVAKRTRGIDTAQKITEGLAWSSIGQNTKA